MKCIVTHPGSAHKDEFLACAVLLSLHTVPIERREPGVEDLDAADIAVVDVGLRHEPELLNFDHHQFARSAPPACALSLVLQYCALYDDARRFCGWLESAEWFDCRGPIDTAAFLGVDREVLDRLVSPVDISLLRRFAASPRHQPGEPIWEVMRLIGADLTGHISAMRGRLDWLKAHVQPWTVGGHLVLFLPYDPSEPDDARGAIRHFVQESPPTQPVVGVVYPDRRGEGFGLSRFEDHPALDFAKIREESDVHFVHARGFLAKTSARSPERLRQLLMKSIAKSHDL